ncbi:MAG: methyltransferase [Myxococcota bacterium]|nr:methyltransferase [Myxococcota bacterium]
MSGEPGKGRGARPTTVRLQQISRAFIESAALRAAIDLKLFTAVAAGHDTPAAFARHAGVTELNAERLMTMCGACGLLLWSDGRYRNADDVARFLVEGEPGYAAAWLGFATTDWRRWGELAERLRDTSPPRPIGDYETMTVEQARRYHEATSSIGFGSGRRFVRQVDLSGRRRMMDLGGGSGAYSITAVQRFEGLTAVVFDLPPVAVVTGEYVEKHDVADRVGVQAGDFTVNPLPSDCDVALMASNLPQYGPAVIRDVVQRAHDALLPGGEMHLIGEMLDDDRSGPVDAAIWGLWEAMANSTGVTHTRSDCLGYFREAGFTNVSAHEFIPGILVRVSGRKRGK